MEAYNESKINRLIPTHPQLKALVTEHRDLDQKITGMITSMHLPEVKLEIAQLKKQKLQIKDQILAYLNKHDA